MRSFFQNLRSGGGSRRPARGIRRIRPGLELLEDRLALSGSGVPAAPVEDAFEENDLFDNAYDLGMQVARTTWSNLALLDGADWFRFRMEGFGSAVFGDTVFIQFQNGEGNLDLNLYNGSGALLASRDTSGNIESISLAGRPPGDYYLQIAGVGGASNPAYNLTIDPGADDGYENNDSLAAAYDLGALAGVRTLGNLQLVDRYDWYRFRMDGFANGSDYARINFLNSQGNLDLRLYDAAGAPLRSAVSTTADQERISLRNLGPGDYYLRVTGAAGASSPNYSLEIDPALDDRFENNDSMIQARNLGLLTTYSLNTDLVMGDEEDWYQFRMDGFGNDGDAVQIDFQHSQGNLRLDLYDDQGRWIAASNYATDQERLSLEGLPPGLYYAHVTGDFNPGYSLLVVPGIDDFAENNDGMALAYDLGVVGRAWFDLELADSADWFRFSVTGLQDGTSYDITTRPRSLLGLNSPLALYLYDQSGTLLRTRGSVGLDDWQTLDFNGLDPGTYYLKIESPTGGLHAGYELEFDLPRDDPYEENDDLGDAADLGIIAPASSSSTGAFQSYLQLTDQADWFRFSMEYPGGPNSKVELTFYDDAAVVDAMDLILFDSQGKFIASSTNVQPRESEAISLTHLPAGTYFAKIEPVHGGMGFYTLWIDVEGDDHFEENDSMAQAWGLGHIPSGTTSFDRLALFDDDWFGFYASSSFGSGSRISLTYETGWGELRMELYDERGRLLTHAIGRDGVLVLPVEYGAGHYYVQIFGAELSEHNPDGTYSGLGQWAVNPEYSLEFYLN